MKKHFNTIAKVTLILVYLVIIAGAVVRMTGSGMGCPDWPKCFGYYIPPTEEAQLQWHPNHFYEDGMVIIVDEALQVAKEDFTTTTSFNAENWEPYTKHDYAIFNAFHTWVEYINRLFGALAGLATLVLLIGSCWYWREKKIITLLSLFTVLGMGFQAWLGKTVVDSNLAPFKITIHMIMALVIVAALLYIVHATSTKVRTHKKDGIFTKLLYVSIVLTLIQIVLGTQVRQFVDEQIHTLGEESKSLWLATPELDFYVHRSFSVVVLLVNVWLFYHFKKLQLGFKKVNWVMILLVLEIISGIAMYYFDFPFGTQTIHIVLATILFGIQFYLILEANKARNNAESL
ncbi:COX15/CtaA family protein [Kordia algicida OT-1]|uniref:Cytochrome oxidase assembly protein n=1 Tax=Kordia algicida OT-1 TaxID=391587 RepID=A9DIC1_9FLAO|nr:COX15/CtaA family protein [Kordia algicida]EDP97872.1 cytochrome oxidase assembly protein [Kordia algicida OT-1]